MKYYLRGELVASDPYADFSADPKAVLEAVISRLHERWPDVGFDPVLDSDVSD